MSLSTEPSARRKSGWTARSCPPSPAPWQPWASCRSARFSWAARRRCRSTTWSWTMLRFQPAASARRPQPPSPRGAGGFPPPLAGEGGRGFPPPLVGEGPGGGSLTAAFDALDRRHIRYAFRKGSEHLNPYAPGAEVAILIDRHQLRAAEHALREQGFHRLAAPGRRTPSFYVGFH